MGTGDPIEGLQGTEIKDCSAVIPSRFVRALVSFREVVKEKAAKVIQVRGVRGGEKLGGGEDNVYQCDAVSVCICACKVHCQTKGRFLTRILRI